MATSFPSAWMRSASSALWASSITSECIEVARWMASNLVIAPSLAAS